MQVGLFGGTFNPIHLGHLRLAEEALNKVPLDQVWFIPTHLPPHKSVAGGVSASDRARMVELAIQGDPRFRISRIELDRPAPSYTMDTVEALLNQPQMKQHTFFFLLGSDAAKELSSWRQIDRLLGLVQFVVIPRPASMVPSRGGPRPASVVPSRSGPRPGASPGALPPGVRWIQADTLDVSASEIRQRIREGDSIEGRVPEAVRRYIQERGLYQ